MARYIKKIMCRRFHTKEGNIKKCGKKDQKTRVDSQKKIPPTHQRDHSKHKDTMIIFCSGTGI